MTEDELAEAKNDLAKIVFIEREIILANAIDLPKISTELVDVLRRMSQVELSDFAKVLQGTPPAEKWGVIADACSASDDARSEQI